MINFELIFVECEICINVHLFTQELPITPTPFFEKTSKFIKFPLQLCQNSADNIHLFLSSLFCSSVLRVSPLPIPYFLDQRSFIVIIEIRPWESSKFVPLFQNCSAYSSSCVCMCVYIFTYFNKHGHLQKIDTHLQKSFLILNRTELNLQITYQGKLISTILNLLVHKIILHISLFIYLISFTIGQQFSA